MKLLSEIPVRLFPFFPLFIVECSTSSPRLNKVMQPLLVPKLHLTDWSSFRETRKAGWTRHPKQQPPDCLFLRVNLPRTLSAPTCTLEWLKQRIYEPQRACFLNACLFVHSFLPSTHPFKSHVRCVNDNRKLSIHVGTMLKCGSENKCSLYIFVKWPHTQRSPDTHWRTWRYIMQHYRLVRCGLMWSRFTVLRNFLTITNVSSERTTWCSAIGL